MATKTAAKKTAAPKPAPAKTAAPKAQKQDGEPRVKAGGKKGDAVVAALTENVALTRTELAEKVGCTVGRVGEVIRYLRDFGSAEEKALIARHLEAKPSRVKATEPAPAKGTAKKAATPTKPAAPKSRTARKTAAAAKDAEKAAAKA